jgi:hypothetical protein
MIARKTWALTLTGRRHRDPKDSVSTCYSCLINHRLDQYQPIPVARGSWRHCSARPGSRRLLGLFGRADVPGCHDSAACLVIDGKVIGALEQERVSRRRYAHGEGAEDAVRILLAAHGLHPSDVQAVGYPWAHLPAGAREPDTDSPAVSMSATS